MVADGFNGSLFSGFDPNKDATSVRGAEHVADQPDGTLTRLSREQIIQQIQAANPTASVEYLQRFENYSLQLYLERLTKLAEPRSGKSFWVRQHETPAITCAIAA
ncbi:MAG: hypothetical protein KDA20_12775 [Phycisphaerales bacterium]|nr:hypothetical protein [Phycisphaerales bacterium]